MASGLIKLNWTSISDEHMIEWLVFNANFCSISATGISWGEQSDVPYYTMYNNNVTDKIVQGLPHLVETGSHNFSFHWLKGEVRETFACRYFNVSFPATSINWSGN